MLKLPKIYKTFQMRKDGSHKTFVEQSKVDEMIYTECSGDYEKALKMKLSIKQLKSMYLNTLGVSLYFSGLGK